jgi:NAD(P)-dependent dehydrogenase (short-subunit alcohol dehydrogenase family)
VNNRNVVITGASSGIGEACAHHLHDRGFRVFAGFRNESDGQRLGSVGSDRLVPLHLDVTKPESIASAMNTVRTTVGDDHLFGLVNNAGVAVGGPLELVPIERLRMQLEVNVIGPVAVTQAFLPLIRRARGRIVNIGSISGRIASPMVGPYSISKFGLEAFSDSLRRELQPWGIRVVLVDPGAIATPIWKKSIDRTSQVLQTIPEEARSLYGEKIEQGRATAVKMSEKAIPAVEVARIVHAALTVTRPRTRYMVGREAKMAALLAWLLPDRALDWILSKS